MFKEIICWIIGGLFFLMAFNHAGLVGADHTILIPSDVRNLALTIAYGLLGLAFVVSGSIFHVKDK